MALVGRRDIGRVVFYALKMSLTPISNNAFAVLAICEETKKNFGITIDPKGSNLKFVWAFKIDKAMAHRERFDSHKVRGTIVLDENFKGCPYCHVKKFFICDCCGTISCYHGQRHVTCLSCGASGEIQAVEGVELKGGGF